jgi:4-hydroxy-tetrahydrodipicolinate synthase
MPFSGSIVALVTPFDAQGRVDFKAIDSLIDWHIAQGTDAFVPCGTTGESPVFTHDEESSIIAHVVQRVAGRRPVIAGAGSNSTAEAVSLSKAAEKAGANGLLQVTPYYNKPNQEGLFQHYRAIREAVGIPLVLYNVPGRTGGNLQPETAARVAALGGIDSVKEASGNLAQAQDLLDLGLRVLSGDDGLTWPIMAMGGHGVISVVANFAPALMKRLCDAAAAGRLAEAQALHRQVHALSKLAFCDTNPIPAKAALHEMGRIGDHLRLPLVPLDAARRTTLVAGLRANGLL